MIKKKQIPKKKSNLLEFLQDVDGALSVKRLLTLFFGFLIGTAVIANLFWHMVLAESLISLLEVIFMALIAGITSEKFTKRGITSVEANDEVMKAKIEEEKTK